MKEQTVSSHVVHLGKKSKKQIKKYRKGYGSMYEEVQQVLARAKSNANAGESVVPMVVVHHRKKKKNNSLFPLYNVLG